MTAFASWPVVVLPRAAYTRGAAGRRRWLEERRNGIGGSDAAAVLGMSPWASPLSTWVEKVRPVADEGGQTEYQKWGTRLENSIARGMAADHGILIGPCPGILAHPERPWQRVTVDRYAVSGPMRRPYGIVEIKNVSGWKAEEWPADAPPDHVVLQVEHALDVTGYDVGYVGALLGGNTPRWYAVERDDDLIGMLRAEEARFWAMVQAGTPPAPIGHDADGDALAALYPGDPGRETVLDGPARSDLAHLHAVKARLKDDKATAEALEQRVKAALGDATEGLRPDGTTAVTWRPQSTTRLDSTALKAARPETWAEFATTTESRVLRLKKETP